MKSLIVIIILNAFLVILCGGLFIQSAMHQTIYELEWVYLGIAIFNLIVLIFNVTYVRNHIK